MRYKPPPPSAPKTRCRFKGKKYTWAATTRTSPVIWSDNPPSSSSSSLVEFDLKNVESKFDLKNVESKFDLKNVEFDESGDSSFSFSAAFKKNYYYSQNSKKITLTPYTKRIKIAFYRKTVIKLLTIRTTIFLQY